MKKLFFPLLAFLFPVYFSAQKAITEVSKSLLWEITGKNGRKTGYLFGTIHLKDKRVFNFYDSLLPAINRCDQFAIEVDPDILVRGSFEMETREDSVLDLREGVKSKEEKDLMDKLEDALGFSLYNMDRKKLRALKRYFGGEKDRADDKPTFLDAWLCDYAKRTGKKIRGLETIEGHMEGYQTIKNGGVGDLDWETIMAAKGKSMLEQMVTNYLSDDHTKIEQMYVTGAGIDERESLAKRNHAMAHAIDSLLKEGTLFSAVGSAHLAGSEGVITLLKKMGYVLKPVNTARSGYYKTLQTEYLNDNWIREAFPEYGYSCAFPSKPFKIERDNTLTYSWTDIGSGINYFAVANFLPEGTNSFMAELTLRMVVEELKRSPDFKVKAGEVKQVEDFTEANTEITSGETNVVRTRYVIKDNVFYTLTAEFHKNNEHPDDVERFLNSLRFIERKEVAWKSFTSRMGAFEVYFPSDPKHKIVKSTSEGYDYESHYYSALDIKSGGNYTLRWFDLPAGVAYSSDSLVLKEYSDDYIQSGTSAIKTIDESYNAFQGYPSYNAFVVYEDYSALKTRTVLRNGRIYTLVFSASKDRLEKIQTNTFFNSFEIKPFMQVKLAKYSHPADPGFSFESPAPVVHVRGDSLPKEFVKSTYASLDPSSGINYFFSIKDLPPYYYAKDEAQFYKDADDLFLKDGDSVYSAKSVFAGEVKMREIVTGSKSVSLQKKVRYFNEGNRIFAIISLAHPSESEMSASANVFKSLSYSGPEKKFDFKKKKTTELLTALRSEDTTVVRAAKEFCADYNFEAEDVEALKTALKVPYPDDAEDGSIRMKLLDALIKFDESATSEFLSSFVSSVKSERKLARKAFENMFRLQNAANKLFVLDALKNGSVNQSVAAEVVESVVEKDPDKMLLYFPQIFSHISKTENWNSLYNCAAAFASAGRVPESEMKESCPLILDNLTFAAAEVETHIAPATFVKWMSETDKDNAKLKEYITKLQSGKSAKGKLQGVFLALENSFDVNKKAIEEVAASPELRLYLFAELQRRDKTELFPKKYMNQREFSDADLAEFLKNYETKVEKVEFYKEAIFEYNGFKQKMFVYKLTYTKNYEQKFAIAYAGPYPVKSDVPIARGTYTGTTMQDFFPDLIEILIRQYIKKKGG